MSMKVSVLGLVSAAGCVLALMNVLAEQWDVSRFVVSQCCFLLVGYSASVLRQVCQGKPRQFVVGHACYILLTVLSVLRWYYLLPTKL
jgi:hypothetical protein